MRRGVMLLALAAMALLAACGSDGDKQQTGQATAAPAATAAAAGTAAPAGTAAAAATPVALQKVTIGYVTVLPWAPIFVAADKGYFKEQGIDPNLQPLSGGAEILTQTAAGNFDVGSGGSSALFNVLGRARSLNQKQAVTIVAPLHLEKPFTTLGVNAGTLKVLDNSYLDGDLATVVFYNAAWAEKNPKLAQGFMNAYLKAVRDLEGGGWSDPATLAILSKYTNTPAETIKAAARPFSDVDGTLNVASLEAQQKFFKEQGRLTYDQLIDLTTVVNTTYAKEAVKVLGPAKR